MQPLPCIIDNRDECLFSFTHAAPGLVEVGYTRGDSGGWLTFSASNVSNYAAFRAALRTSCGYSLHVPAAEHDPAAWPRMTARLWHLKALPGSPQA